MSRLDDVNRAIERLDNVRVILESSKVSLRERTEYARKIRIINEIGSLLRLLDEIIKEDKDITKEDLIEADQIFASVTNTITIITNNIKTLIGNVQEDYKPAIDEYLLDKEIKNIEKQKEDRNKLVKGIYNVRNSSIDKYISSITSDMKLKKYPWMFYIHKPATLVQHIQGKDDDTKHVSVFQIVLKEIYLITKINIRNINMLRISDIEPTNSMYINYRNILEKLLYTLVPEEFVPSSGFSGPLTDHYLKHQSTFKNLIGKDNYKKFIFHIANDSENFKDRPSLQEINVFRKNDDKHIKTETLLKYLVIASQNIKPEEYSINKLFINDVIKVINDIIAINSNILKLEVIANHIKADIKSKHNEINNIFTFVKIRADDLTEINDRYRITLDVNRYNMYVGYNPSPESLYVNNVIKDKKYTNFDEPLPSNYLFGPYTYIFKPHEGNEEISNHDSLKPLIEKIQTGKSVCIIGYGASGSGKTSTLIHASYETKKERQNGVLINICNMMGNRFDEIELSFIEMEANVKMEDNQAVADYKTIPIPEDEKDSGKYNESDREKEKFYQKRTFTYRDGKWGDLYLQELGDYINVAANKRTILATTNNSVSSRSHVIIFIRFKGSNFSPYLIVCDFAGVENKFECDNIEVLRAFENIKSEITCTKKQCVPFYKEQIENEIGAPDDGKIKINPMSNIKVNGVQPLVEHLKTKEHMRESRAIEEIKSSLISLKKIFKDNKSEISNETDLKKRFENNRDEWTSSVLKYIWGVNYTGLTNNLKKLYETVGKDNSQAIENINSAIEYVTNYGNKNTSLSQREKHKQRVLKNICKDRVKEGMFINNSLENFRLFISYFITRIQNNSRVNPKFIDLCAPIQCNPNFEDCFGMSTLNDKIDNDELNNTSVIANKIREKICCDEEDEKCNKPPVSPSSRASRKRSNKNNLSEDFKSQGFNLFKNCDEFKDMTFCIFNVINISRNANDPPPVPYLDISFLVNEQLRLESVGKMVIPVKIEAENQDIITQGVNINDSSSSHLVYKPYLLDILNSPLLKDISNTTGNPPITIKGELRKNIILKINELIKDHEYNPPIENTITKLKGLIQYINNINSLSLIGTLEFTDMISKFGLNRNVCNYKYNPNTRYTGKYIKEGLLMLDEYKKFIVDLYKKQFQESIFTY